MLHFFDICGLHTGEHGLIGIEKSGDIAVKCVFADAGLNRRRGSCAAQQSERGSEAHGGRNFWIRDEVANGRNGKFDVAFRQIAPEQSPVIMGGSQGPLEDGNCAAPEADCVAVNAGGFRSGRDGAPFR